MVLQVEYARGRSFRDDGTEVEPEQTRATKLQRGWLNQFTHLKAKDQTVLSPDELSSRLSGAEGPGPLPAGFYDEGLAALHPKRQGRFEFWVRLACDRCMYV